MKIIQISDTHIPENQAERLFELVNADNTLLDVLALVKAEAPDMVIATGDLSAEGSVASYLRLEGYLNGLGCPVYVIPGNHDVPDNLAKNLVSGNIKQVGFLATSVANFIFLNSYKPNTNGGFLNAAELAHLEECLVRYDNCIVVVHHHFVKLNTLIDKYILENHNELVVLLNKYKTKIKFCITGHVHNSYHYKAGEVDVYSSLSTCIQFAKTKEFLFDNKSPGYTVYDILAASCKVKEVAL